MIDIKHVDNIEIEGIDYSDYPEFTDAFISSADYKGEPMNEEELEELNKDYDLVYDQVINKIM